MAVLRYMLGNTEIVYLNFSKSDDSLFPLYFMEAMGLGSCRVVRLIHFLEQGAEREGLRCSDSVY